MKIRIFFIAILIILVLSIETFAKYNYTYILTAYKLSRDDTEITYTITKNIEDDVYTNKDILLTISLNKPVDNVYGFDLSEDRKTLTRLLTENESQTIVVEDDSGNRKKIDYTISNIDKEPPKINGIENGKTYNSNVAIEYTDNVGIKDVLIDNYSNSLILTCYDDYYDTATFKGTDLTDSFAIIRVIGHPKNTKTYKYYINNVFKEQSENKVYKFSGLSKGTSYTIKVEAIDEFGNVLDTKTRIVKTKLYSRLEATKNTSGSFTYTVYGIDPDIDKVEAVAFTNEGNKIHQPLSINSNRTVTVNTSAQSVTGNIQNGYYYFHLQLFDNEKGGVVDTACFNVKFNESFVESTNSSSNIDINNLTSNGNYQIIVTDLAGNKTEKTITISK